MILKLQGADFSTNNIGTLDLRTAPDTQTANLLALYGKSWTLDKQLAINDFLLGVQAASYYSKISKLLLPILAPTSTISLTTTPTNNIAFYDIKNASYAQVKSGIPNDYHKINAKGVYADTFVSGASNGLTLNNLCQSSDKNNLHIGIYYNASNLNDAVAGNTYTIALEPSSARVGFSSGSADVNYDPNTRLPKGLKIFSVTPTQITGLNNNLPLSSVTVNASNNADFTTYPHFNLLSIKESGYDIKSGTTIGLVTLGTALTQPETVAYNQLIATLMDKLWV